MNQKDWLAAEVLAQARSEASRNVIVMQGSLLKLTGSAGEKPPQSHTKGADEHQCVCGKAEGGTIPCSQVKEAGCNDENLQIRIPQVRLSLSLSLPLSRSPALQLSSSLSVLAFNSNTSTRFVSRRASSR
jgi:hypothetical protein